MGRLAGRPLEVARGAADGVLWPAAANGSVMITGRVGATVGRVAAAAVPATSGW
jgi:hypothetical protein